MYHRWRIWKMRKHIEMENLKGRGHLEDEDIDGKVILE
jgi:hypothetical protein